MNLTSTFSFHHAALIPKTFNSSSNFAAGSSKTSLTTILSLEHTNPLLITLPYLFPAFQVKTRWISLKHRSGNAIATVSRIQPKILNYLLSFVHHIYLFNIPKTSRVLPFVPSQLLPPTPKPHHFTGLLSSSVSSALGSYLLFSSRQSE